jgi:hypothetical protein
MPKHPYSTPNREQHGTPKIIPNPPASTVAKALSQNKAQVDKSK